MTSRQEKIIKKRREWLLRQEKRRKGKLLRLRKFIPKWAKGDVDSEQLCLARFTLRSRMAVGMRRSLNLGKHSSRCFKWETLVGYTVEDLRKQFEQQFTEGMTWENFMRGEIHIDHKIPHVKFKFTKAEDKEFRICWSLNNLQPLWAKDNLRKGCRVA